MRDSSNLCDLRCRRRPSGLSISCGGRNPIGDATFGEIVRGHFHFNFIPNIEANVVLAHFARNMSEYGVTIDQLDAKEGAFEHRLNDSFYFDYFACHKRKILPEGQGKRNLIP